MTTGDSHDDALMIAAAILAAPYSEIVGWEEMPSMWRRMYTHIQSLQRASRLIDTESEYHLTTHIRRRRRDRERASRGPKTREAAAFLERYLPLTGVSSTMVTRITGAVERHLEWVEPHAMSLKELWETGHSGDIRNLGEPSWQAIGEAMELSEGEWEWS